MKNHPVLIALLLVGLVIAFQCTVTAPARQAAFPTGGESGEPQITITEAWARPSPMSAANGAIYMKLMNAGSRSDVLLRVDAAVAETVELHETRIDENDVMRMSPVPNIELPAGEMVMLEPGGKHVMLINLKQQLTAGQKITVTLDFEQSDRVTVEAEVRAGGDIGQNVEDMEQD